MWTDCKRLAALLVATTGLGAAVAAVGEQKESLPFLLISAKTPLPDVANAVSQQAAMSGLESELLLETVRDCAYDAYVFVEQPGVTARQVNVQSMPFLFELTDKSLRTVSVSSLQDANAYTGSAEDYIVESCGVKKVEASETGQFEQFTDTQPRLITLKFPETASANLREHDDELKASISHLVSANFLLVYRATLPSTGTADVAAADETRPEKPQPAQPDVPENASLFEKYQFFSPGIWMTTLVSLLLVTFLIIALGWLESLRVTLRAFEKTDTGSSKR